MSSWEHTISMHYAKAVLRGLSGDEKGLSYCLDKANISPALMNEDDARISIEQLSRLINTQIVYLGDEMLGLCTSPMKIGSFQLVAMHCQHANALRNVFMNAARAYSLLGNEISLRVERGIETTKISFINSAETTANEQFLYEFLMLVWHRFPSWLVGKTVPLIEINLPYAKPHHAEEHRLMFPNAVHYGADECSFIIANADLNILVTRTAKETEQYLADVPWKWFRRLAFYSRTTQGLNMLFQAAPLNKLPSISEAATALETSERSLRRQLAVEGQRFQALKDTYLRDSAISFLLQGRLSVSDIAHKLGYSEPAAFSRAFKKWTKNTPNAYRRQEQSSKYKSEK